MITTIEYYSQSGTLLDEDDGLNFLPAVGQVIENKFLKDGDCSGVFYICDIDIFKNTPDNYICVAKAWEKENTEENGSVEEAVQRYYQTKNPINRL